MGVVWVDAVLGFRGCASDPPVAAGACVVTEEGGTTTLHDHGPDEDSHDDLVLEATGTSRSSAFDTEASSLLGSTWTNMDSDERDALWHAAAQERRRIVRLASSV